MASAMRLRIAAMSYFYMYVGCTPYNPDTGNFKSSSGAVVKFDDAQTWISKKI
jgi:hypothetical protein